MRRLTPFLLALSFALSLHAAEWRSSGPAGGFARALAAAPTDSRTLYLASSGGVFRSLDGGASWRDVSGPIPHAAALAIDPHDARIVYAAAGPEGGTIYKSIDGGESWRLAGQGLPSPLRTSAILVDPRDSNVVYVGSYCAPIFGRTPSASFYEAAGVFKSTDGGETFLPSMNGLSGFTSCVTGLSFDPLNPDTLYASPVYGDSGYARSDDRGATWVTARSPVPGNGSVVDPRDPSRRYGIVNATFLASEDGGLTWANPVPRLVDGSYLPAWGLSAIAIDPASGRIFVSAQQGLYRSGDGGRTFMPVEGAGREFVTTMLFDAVLGSLTIGTATGVYHSEAYPWDVWSVASTGDTSLEMRDVVTSLRDPQTAYASSQRRLFVTGDGGHSWQILGNELPSPSGTPSFVTGLAVDAGENVYACTREGDVDRLYRLPAGERRWVMLNAPQTSTGAIFTGRRVPGVLYLGATGGFSVSRDHGATWSRLALPEGQHGYSIASDPQDENVLYGITSNGLVKSSDAGRSWTLKLAGANAQSSIAMSSSDGGATLYVNGVGEDLRSALFRSSDRGESWTRVTQPDAFGVFSMTVDPRDPGTLYANSLGSAEVFRSADGGWSWSSVGGLPYRTRSLAFNANGTILHATTASGVWEKTIRGGRRRAVSGRE